MKDQGKNQLLYQLPSRVFFFFVCVCVLSEVGGLEDYLQYAGVSTGLNDT